MKIQYLQAKYASDSEIITFLKTHMNVRLIEASQVEIENWSLVRKEAQKRKIGPASINIDETRNWK